MRAALLTLVWLALPGWTEIPVYSRLFTPARVVPGAYRAYISPRPLGEIARELRQETPGSFAPHLAAPADAFGQSGGYNRWQLARLYGARRVQVARGPRYEGGRVVEAWTLISPYPDADLRRLEPGTLLIVFSLR